MTKFGLSLKCLSAAMAIMQLLWTPMAVAAPAEKANDYSHLSDRDLLTKMKRNKIEAYRVYAQRHASDVSKELFWALGINILDTVTRGDRPAALKYGRAMEALLAKSEVSSDPYLNSPDGLALKMYGVAQLGLVYCQAGTAQDVATAVKLCDKYTKSYRERKEWAHVKAVKDFSAQMLDSCATCRSVLKSQLKKR